MMSVGFIVFLSAANPAAIVPTALFFAMNGAIILNGMT